MDRRSLIKNAGIAGVLAAGVAPAVHAQAAVRWRLASSFPKSLDTIFGAAEVFAKQVKAMSGGKFEISVHAAGELMPAFGVVDGVQQGSVEAAHTAPYYFFGKDEAFALGCAIPFGLNSRQMTAWMYEGNGLKLMREFYAKYNMISFAGGNTGAQMGGWFRKEIKSLGRRQGPEDAHRRLRRQGARAHRRRAAEHPGRRDLHRRWKRARSTRPSGWARTTTRSWASTRSRRTTTTPAGGKAARAGLLHQPEGLRRAVGREQGHRGGRSRRTPTSTCRPSTTPSTPLRSSSWSAPAPSCARSPQDVMDAAFKEAMAPVRGAQRQEPGAGTRSTPTTPSSAPTRTCGSASPKPRFDRFMQAQKL